MSRVYKTKNNLEKAWTNLDLAYEHLEKAFEMLENMSGLSSDLINDMEIFDITIISSIKAEIEEMLEEVK